LICPVTLFREKLACLPLARAAVKGNVDGEVMLIVSETPLVFR